MGSCFEWRLVEGASSLHDSAEDRETQTGLLDENCAKRHDPTLRAKAEGKQPRMTMSGDLLRKRLTFVR
jgi:hypothetical protein